MNFEKTSLGLAAVTTGLVAGLFFAYQVSVNPAFKKLPDGEYIRAMQAINVAIQNPIFLSCFTGNLLFLGAATYLHRAFVRRHLEVAAGGLCALCDWRVRSDRGRQRSSQRCAGESVARLVHARAIGGSAQQFSRTVEQLASGAHNRFFGLPGACGCGVFIFNWLENRAKRESATENVALIEYSNSSRYNLRMKTKRAVWPLVVLTIVSSLPAYSYLVGHFSTLDRQIERADAIAVVSVMPGNDFTIRGGTPIRCFVQETLKGELVPQKEETLNLTYPDNISAFGRAYLVFLTKPSTFHVRETYKIYRSLSTEGSVMAIPYHYDGLPTKGATTKEKIQTLLRNYIKQRDERLKRENVLLNKMLK